MHFEEGKSTWELPDQKLLCDDSWLGSYSELEGPEIVSESGSASDSVRGCSFWYNIWN